MLGLLFRTAEFLFYKGLMTVVDHVSRLPRDSAKPEPEAMRLYRENIALKAQLDALERHQKALERHIEKLEAEVKPPAPMPKKPPVAVRAAQVFAYMLTRGSEPFQRYFLSAPLGTIRRWATRFRFGRRPEAGGRPPIEAEVVELIVTLKRENPAWGQRRIREELRRMGIRVAEPTIARILREHGFLPRSGPFRKPSFDRVRAAVKDALWALDFFLVKTTKGEWLQSLLIIDVHTRELLDIRAYDGWEADSGWTTSVVADVIARTGRKPGAVVHDHGPNFLGHFQRQMRVLEIGEEITPVYVPQMNCYAERAIGSVRRELLRHIRVPDVETLQFYLDEYRQYANTERPHQGLEGRTPEEVSTAAPEAEVIDLAAVGADRLVRRPYAHGLLQGYTLARAA